MKLSDVAPTDGIGYREVLEREALAQKARTAAREAARERLLHFERALRGQAAPDVAFAAERILAIIEGEPERYLDPKVLRVPDERALAKPVKQTPGMITNNRFIIRMHLLAVATIAKLVPQDDELAGIVADAANGAKLLENEEPK